MFTVIVFNLTSSYGHVRPAKLNNLMGARWLAAIVIFTVSTASFALLPEKSQDPKREAMCSLGTARLSAHSVRVPRAAPWCKLPAIAEVLPLPTQSF